MLHYHFLIPSFFAREIFRLLLETRVLMSQTLITPEALRAAKLRQLAKTRSSDVPAASGVPDPLTPTSPEGVTLKTSVLLPLAPKAL